MSFKHGIINGETNEDKEKKLGQSTKAEKGGAQIFTIPNQPYLSPNLRNQGCCWNLTTSNNSHSSDCDQEVLSYKREKRKREKDFFLIGKGKFH